VKCLEAQWFGCRVSSRCPGTCHARIKSPRRAVKAISGDMVWGSVGGLVEASWILFDRPLSGRPDSYGVVMVVVEARGLAEIACTTNRAHFVRRLSLSLSRRRNSIRSCANHALLPARSSYVSGAWHSTSCGAAARRRHDPGSSVNRQASGSLAHQPAAVVRCSALCKIRLARLHTRRARPKVARRPPAMGLSEYRHCPRPLGRSLCGPDHCTHGPG
jgi:hypothetical protein